MPRKRAEEPVELDENPVICAFDPGGTSGWSVLRVHAEALVRPDVSILENMLHWTHGQFVGPENEQASEIIGIISSFPGCCVLFEDFILRTANGGREVLSPVRITAKVSYGLFLAGGPEIHTQAASEAKNVATDARLKLWGFYQRTGGLEHARDADRHGLTWLRKAKQYPWMRAACWPYLYGAGQEFDSTPEGEFGPASADENDEDEDIG